MTRLRGSENDRAEPAAGFAPASSEVRARCLSGSCHTGRSRQKEKGRRQKGLTNRLPSASFVLSPFPFCIVQGGAGGVEPHHLSLHRAACYRYTTCRISEARRSERGARNEDRRSVDCFEFIPHPSSLIPRMILWPSGSGRLPDTEEVGGSIPPRITRTAPPAQPGVRKHTGRGAGDKRAVRFVRHVV